MSPGLAPEITTRLLVSARTAFMGGNFPLVIPSVKVTIRSMSFDVFERYRRFVSTDELEFVDGSVYANIRQSDRGVRIDPESGA